MLGYRDVSQPREFVFSYLRNAHFFIQLFTKAHIYSVFLSILETTSKDECGFPDRTKGYRPDCFVFTYITWRSLVATRLVPIVQIKASVEEKMVQ